MNKTITATIIRVADFTTLPGARYRSDGDNSADAFFEECILPVLEKSSVALAIDLDNTMGYASSFISQLAQRIFEFLHSSREVKRRIILISNDDPTQKDAFWNEIVELTN